ncbi:MAG: caspase family protein [Thermoanaerobaculia bacterium]
MTTPVESPTLRALLIGVDHYQPPPADHDGPSYRSLSGCVHDVRRMESFLVQHLGVPASRIRKLTASDPPTEPASDLPTYDNMVAAFRELGRAGRPGDQVLIHYSGHGGRIPTHFPRLKPFDPYDEALVPTDIRRPDSQYLRDVELAYLLTGMVERGLFATLVLDSCHAGGNLRREEPKRVSNPVARDNDVGGWERRRPSLVAPEAALAERWHRLNDSPETLAGRRREGSGWLPSTAGFVLLAACRPHEQAYEYAVAPGQQGGALTHWFLDTLETLGTGISYRQLHDRVYGRIHELLEFQSPQLEGADDRRVFSCESLQLRHGVNVLRVEDRRLLLNTGQAQGARRGARFAVFPSGWCNDDLTQERLAVVEIDELGGTESWTRIVESHRSEAPEPGCLALPLALGPLRRRRTVRWGRGEDPDAGRRGTLETLTNKLKKIDNGFLEWVGSDQPAEYQLTVDSGGEIEIRDATGGRLPNQQPQLSVDEGDVAGRLIARLEHLARYRHVAELHNHDAASPLHGRLEVELGLLPPDYDPADPSEPVADTGRLLEVREGDWLCLVMRNRSEQVLNFTVLDLQPRWSIRQIHPLRGDYLVIEPAGELRLALQASLPPALEAGSDLLKVFATVDPTNFRWLELPTLDEPICQHRAAPPSNALEEILLALTEGRPRLRDMTRATHASREWMVEEVEVRIRRR